MTYLKTFIFVALAAGAASAGAQNSSYDTNTNGSVSRSAGQFIDDAAITTTIKAKLVADKTTKARDIKVETRNGVVQLSGAVDSAAELQRAQSIAQSVDGVQSVKNELSLKAP